jgi:hypothetical protein
MIVPPVMRLTWRGFAVNMAEALAALVTGYLGWITGAPVSIGIIAVSAAVSMFMAGFPPVAADRRRGRLWYPSRVRSVAAGACVGGVVPLLYSYGWRWVFWLGVVTVVLSAVCGRETWALTVFGQRSYERSANRRIERAFDDLVAQMQILGQTVATEDVNDEDEI